MISHLDFSEDYPKNSNKRTNVVLKIRVANNYGTKVSIKQKINIHIMTS